MEAIVKYLILLESLIVVVLLYCLVTINEEVLNHNKVWRF